MSENSFAFKSLWTKYNGITYRSRSEARWAVFFDTMQVKAIYEPEGFRLPNGVCYLPDFYLPDYDSFVEVKGILESNNRTKGEELSKVTGKAIIFGQADMGYEIHTPADAKSIGLFTLPSADEARQKARNWKFEYTKDNESRQSESERKSRSANTAKIDLSPKEKEDEAALLKSILLEHGIQSVDEANENLIHRMLLHLGSRILYSLMDCSFDIALWRNVVQQMRDNKFKVEKDRKGEVQLTYEIYIDALNDQERLRKEKSIFSIGFFHEMRIHYDDLLDRRTIKLSTDEVWWITTGAGVDGWAMYTTKSDILDIISRNIQALRCAFMRTKNTSGAGFEMWRSYSPYAFREKYIRKMQGYCEYVQTMKTDGTFLNMLFELLDHYEPKYSNFCCGVLCFIYRACGIVWNLPESDEYKKDYKLVDILKELRIKYKNLKVR